MRNYVIFISNNGARAIVKEKVTHSFVKEMKEKGFRKHHTEIVAENEKDAIAKLNNNNESYLNALGGLTGSALICSVIIIVVTLIYCMR